MDILGWKICIYKIRPMPVTPDDNRPVKWVPDGYNTWRIVWADEKTEDKK